MSVEKRVIKKYPNRRLYDTATSSYITLGDVKQLVLENVDIQVVDAKSQDDITRSVLLQIILEEENGGMPMFSYEVLTQFIRFYGQAMQGMMGPFLEKNLQLFGQMQQKLQEQTRAMYGDKAVFNTTMWGEFMKLQGPAIQNVMSSYMEQSTGMFLEMQNRMQEQTKQLFSGFTFPGYVPPGKDDAGKS
ncbi:polyhydroxyalkanoate synthesis repressor PhaR [Aquitalea sp. FJL05]|jgi:polyhydroxyalkanoate synthesis repressor PhaR|uniref:Polyhydroxyalkanoate synthesis repressor PhaR n=3 Tax=Aquitalea TaxID=407217 RepID=A0A318JC36_9NEIS|nr:MULTISPECIES: polyhydroxyalkanoate synthesis repressor PhaR [Aquitalea]MBA4707575.1 polyhydroxyalkanoate synthesis repressor PhaR [Aquitalea magnusonii]PXX45712.1 polyhydroxyalkanoate synthesis repressor PhaR [Aquitalea magnusonii]RMC95571.1 polyhydroxyalkanoate synthesis repressor PhaR [Aquitalea palustris]RQO73115.1 polyhydroxyalkanoate synthesis repressor PhaR [Aquitalea sp. FJL05]